MNVNVRKLVDDYLKEARLMQVATSKNSKPWVATVWFASDKNLNLYFISRHNRRHSQELQDNPNVAGTIVKPHKTLGDKTQGLQFEGKCSQVERPELIKAFTVFLKRYPNVVKFIKSAADVITGKTDHRFYKISPKIIVLFDEINFPDNSRQELKVITT